jgi:hypothetical protein
MAQIEKKQKLDILMLIRIQKYKLDPDQNPHNSSLQVGREERDKNMYG